MRRISDSATVVTAPDLLATEFHSEFVILNLKDGVYYGLDDVGARVWMLLQSPLTVQTLRETLVSEYDVEPSRCDEDIQSLLGDLVSRGLVDVREPDC